MKVLFILLMFLSGIAFAQPGQSTVTKAQGDTLIVRLRLVNSKQDSTNVKLDELIALNGGGSNFDSLVTVATLIKLLSDTMNTSTKAIYLNTLPLSAKQDTTISRLSTLISLSESGNVKLDTISSRVGDLSNAELEANTDAILAKTDTILTYNKPTTSFNGGNVVVDTTATQLIAISAPCRYVYLMNNTPNTEVYTLMNSGITLSNGYGRLRYLDEIRIEVDNANKVYLISNVANTSVRFYYGN